MAGFPIFPTSGFDYIPALVDHRHERLHQHNTFLGVLARRAPDQQQHPNYPDVDLSDAGKEYLIDIEVPGVAEPSSISCHWTAWKTLVITGIITRPWKAQGSGDAKKNVAQGPDNRKSDGIGHKTIPEDHDPEAQEGPAPCLLVGERRIGFFRREFRFPAEVDSETMSARLENGLICVKVPKHTISHKHLARAIPVNG